MHDHHHIPSNFGFTSLKKTNEMVPLLGWKEFFFLTKVALLQNLFTILAAVPQFANHFLDTHVSLAPTHVCLSVGWSVGR